MYKSGKARAQIKGFNHLLQLINYSIHHMPLSSSLAVANKIDLLSIWALKIPIIKVKYYRDKDLNRFWAPQNQVSFKIVP